MTHAVLVVGALGRMGERVRAAVAEEPSLRLQAAIEAPGHPDIGSALDDGVILADDPKAAAAHLEKADPNDPFQTLLLARAYERTGRKDDARQAYERVVASENNGLERALAYSEARKKLSS